MLLGVFLGMVIVWIIKSPATSERVRTQARTYEGTSAISRASGRQQVLRIISNTDTGKHLIAKDIWELCLSASDIEFAIKENFRGASPRHLNPLVITKKYLDDLNCKTPDEFMELAQSLPQLSNRTTSPHFQNEKDKGFQRLHKFLADAIEYRH